MLLFKHDFFGKPVPTFPDHPGLRSHGPLARKACPERDMMADSWATRINGVRAAAPLSRPAPWRHLSPAHPKEQGLFFAASNRRRSVCEWESGGLRQTPAAYFFRRKLHCATVPWLGLASKLRAVLLSHRFTVSAVRPTSSKISTTSSLGTTTSPDALRRKLARACTHKLVASHATVGPLNIWALILLASSATAFS
jgi:hypothetical protein